MRDGSRVTTTKRGSSLHIGAAIRQRRQEMGLRTEDVASRTGLAMGTIQRIERGEDARLRTFQTIADALETTVADLLSGAAA